MIRQRAICFPYICRLLHRVFLGTLAWAVLCVWALHPGYAFPPHAPNGGATEEDITERDPEAAAARESQLLAKSRQLTFEGRRAGEGYFSRDGLRMVFQSEREPNNPFFQIYVLDLETGDTDRISPGIGKTTCAWLHPSKAQVLFASTHQDPEARAKQEAEIALRESGKQRRYSWDYDEHFDIHVFDIEAKSTTNITHTRGYDAEGSWSPDGQWIAFTSNRLAYSGTLTEAQQKAFEIDPAYLNDIFLCRSDGSEVRQLTSVPGYDGGPFFSPDGKRICWRRFASGGATAEIMTMNTDGSDQRQLTNLQAMSWAPFYHPSGKYLIFTTNLHGFANFELYLIDVQGKTKPVRVTYTKGFDGLPAFTPEGRQLAWTTNRTTNGQSQIFLADWNHQQALQLLGLDAAGGEDAIDDQLARDAATAASLQTSADCNPQDIMRHVDFLCRPELEGRLTGTPGEQMATAYVAAYMDSLGLRPAGDDGWWYQMFEFTSGVSLGKANRMAWGDRSYRVDEDWLPLSFSKAGQVVAAPVVFAGYGIQAPKSEGQDEYDSFVHLDVKDKWILAFRFMPEDIPPERRQQLSRFSSLRFKAMLARDKGAKGLILVSGPNSKVKHQLPRLRFDGTLSGASVPVISVTDETAAAWLSSAGKNLQTLQDKADSGEPMMGFELDGVQLSASIDIQQEKRTGRNVLGILPAGDKPSDELIIVGAHVDHLGKGASSSSLARDDEENQIHYGADDNASGTAAMLEVAQYLAGFKTSGRLNTQRDILFAAWSGEELGLIGASHFAKTFTGTTGKAAHGGDQEHGKTGLYPRVAACLNMDMVGRLDKKLILQGAGSSSIWPGEIERRNAPVGLPITLQNDSYLPTDASVFYLRGVPILSAFTGSHSEYHTPRDTPATLNYEGAARIARLIALIARSVARSEQAPDYVAQTAPRKGEQRAGLRAYLGTIPDYAESDLKGVKLSGVAAKGPAAAAGVRGGDIIVELAGRKVENIYDYTYAIGALKIGQETTIAVQRGERRIELKVTPGSRE